VPYPYAAEREELLARLRRIEGQVRGVQRMVEQDAYCIDLLTQVSAVVSGMEKVGVRVLREHLRGCMADAMRSGEAADDKIEELVKVLERFVSL
jgi:CsoR family transcriptional regulator, copper-sensing transcriptional repressor